VPRRVVRQPKEEAYRLERRREPLPTRVRDTPTLPIAYDDALEHGLVELGLHLARDARAAIDGHVRLLLAWTEAINLTAIRGPGDVARQHVVDSLTAVPLLRARDPGPIIDLGSGGGFPGIPLAAALPDVPVTLLDPIAKKTRFLAAVVEAIGLGSRVAVATARAEDVARDIERRETWAFATARAVASTPDLIELSFPLLARGGSLIAWKRGDLTAELTAARRAIEALGGGTIEVVDVPVSALRDHRLLVATRSAMSVPDRYPRDPSARRRRPW
jgi:16S rRNA (guanine527-N7)-methyltransferase